jgi:hypothetical protein
MLEKYKVYYYISIDTDKNSVFLKPNSFKSENYWGPDFDISCRIFLLDWPKSSGKCWQHCMIQRKYIFERGPHFFAIVFKGLAHQMDGQWTYMDTLDRSRPQKGGGEGRHQ